MRSIEAIKALPYLSRREATLYLGVSLSTIDRLIRSKEIPVKRMARKVLIPRVALDDWVNSLKGRE
jgi:excisionase family DNA binding protein